MRAAKARLIAPYTSEQKDAHELNGIYFSWLQEPNLYD